MCMPASCGTCSKQTWRGCGAHIPGAMAGVPEGQWCTCEPRVAFGGRQYPPAAGAPVPGASWLGGVFGGQKKEAGQGGKGEL